MPKEKPKPQLFSKNVILGIFITLVGGMLVAAFFVGSVYGGEVALLPPPVNNVKVVKPLLKNLDSPVKAKATVPIEDIELKTVDIVPQPDQMITTTIQVKRPNNDETTPFTEHEAVDLLVDYFNKNGCTVLMSDPEGRRDKMFMWSLQKTACTILTIHQTVESMPMAAATR